MRGQMGQAGSVQSAVESSGPGRLHVMCRKALLVLGCPLGSQGLDRLNIHPESSRMDIVGDPLSTTFLWRNYETPFMWGCHQRESLTYFNHQ